MGLSMNGIVANYSLSRYQLPVRPFVSMAQAPRLESLLQPLSINITKEINNESVNKALLCFSLVERIIAMFDLEKEKDKAGKVNMFYGSTQTAVSSIKVSSYLFYILLQGQFSQYSLMKLWK